MAEHPSSLRQNVFSVTAEDNGERLDRFLFNRLTGIGEPGVLTRSQISGWIRAGYVTVNRVAVTKAGCALKAGSTVECVIPTPPRSQLEPDPAVRISVLFEDEHILVLDKPAGLVVHPGAGARSATLVHGLLHHLGSSWQPVGALERPGLVHRLDRDTSGVMVVAKTEPALRALASQFKPPRRISRTYLALCFRLPRAGRGSTVLPDGHSGAVDLPVGRHPSVRTAMAVVEPPAGKPAQTTWRLLEAFGFGALVEATLHTGRTHQIRVHFQAVGAPLVGDPRYSAQVPASLPRHLADAVRAFPRQALHARTIEFDHPHSGQRVRYEASIPTDFQRLLDAFRQTDHG